VSSLDIRTPKFKEKFKAQEESPLGRLCFIEGFGVFGVADGIQNGDLSC
jgi:hypothetical protein